MSVIKHLVPILVLVAVPLSFVFSDTAKGPKQSSESPLFCSEFRGRDGAAEATRDLDKNCARYCIYGRSAGLVYLKEWSELSEQRFGVKIQAIAGCMVTDDLVSYAKSYNRVVLDHVAKKYGDNAWTDCSNQVAEDYKRNRNL